MFDKWRTFAEVDDVGSTSQSNWMSDPNYVQKSYKAFFVLSLDKTRGGDRAETISEIRSIPNVTTVTKESERQDSATFEQNLYSIKFVLLGNQSSKSFVDSVLMPGLKEIEGVTVNWFKGIEDIE